MMAISLGVFAALLIIGAPIVLALGVGALAALVYQGVPLSLVATRMFAGLDSFPLMAIPFFILAGECMNTGGITRRLVTLANAMVGHMVGGLSSRVHILV
ncbi:MAG: TRAP transporter large permease subunit [Firmicutes bacterium]|jgi:C4-dicarboxylate transporter DctM subunit|nr:TRAP transporter large permease subunit [Bacillota bacterium]